MMESKIKNGRRNKRPLQLKESSKKYEYRASQKEEKVPPISEPPQIKDHVDEYVGSNQSLLDDSSLGLEITWDHNLPCHSTVSSGKRIDELLSAFPSVVSPVSKGRHMSLTSMEQQGNVHHHSRNRRREIDQNGLERLKCLANMLQNQHRNTDCLDLDDASNNYVAPKNKENMRTNANTSGCSSPFHDSFYESANILDQLDNWDDDDSPASKKSPAANFRHRSISTSTASPLASSKPSSTPSSLSPVNLFRKNACSLATTATPHVHSLALSSDNTSAKKSQSSNNQDIGNNATSNGDGINDIETCDDIGDIDDDIGDIDDNIGDIGDAFDDTDDDDDIFWTQVANTKEELLLTDDIDQLFQLDSPPASTNFSQTSSNPGSSNLPARSSTEPNSTPLYTGQRPFKNLKFGRSNSEPMQSPDLTKKSLCSQEDIERKRQMAKRKLQMRMKST